MSSGEDTNSEFMSQITDENTSFVGKIQAFATADDINKVDKTDEILKLDFLSEIFADNPVTESARIEFDQEMDFGPTSPSRQGEEFM